MLRLNHVLLVLIVGAFLDGCTAIKTMPIAARSGDTITVALGSQDGMRVTNTTATFTDSTGITTGLTPRAIFNLYPDKRSNAYGDSYNLIAGVSHEPWLTVMVVNLPAGLPTGNGTIKVNTTAAQPSGPNTQVQQMNYRLEILPGVGTPHDLRYSTIYGEFGGNINRLQRVSSQAYINPPAINACNGGIGYGAIELKFQLPFVIPADEADVDSFRVIAEDLTAYNAAGKPQQPAWSARGNLLTVLFVSADGTLRCYEPKFSLLPAGQLFSVANPPILQSVNYYDVDGVAAAGPSLSQYVVSVR